MQDVIGLVEEEAVDVIVEVIVEVVVTIAQTGVAIGVTVVQVELFATLVVSMWYVVQLDVIG